MQSRSVPCGAHKRMHGQSQTHTTCRGCSGSPLLRRMPPHLQEHASGCIQSGCAAFHACASDSVLVWVHFSGRQKRLASGFERKAARHCADAGGLKRAGDSHLAHSRAVKRFSTSNQTKSGCCCSFPSLHNCCGRPRAASEASRAPTKHLDPDMHTARNNAAGMAHGPGRGGLGRSRYIEFTAGQRRDKSAMPSPGTKLSVPFRGLHTASSTSR